MSMNRNLDGTVRPSIPQHEIDRQADYMSAVSKDMHISHKTQAENKQYYALVSRVQSLRDALNAAERELAIANAREERESKKQGIVGYGLNEKFEKVPIGEPVPEEEEEHVPSIGKYWDWRTNTIKNIGDSDNDTNGAPGSDGVKEESNNIKVPKSKSNKNKKQDKRVLTSGRWT